MRSLERKELLRAVARLRRESAEPGNLPAAVDAPLGEPASPQSP